MDEARKGGRDVFVVDGGFGFVKWLYGDRKGKVRSAYKKQGDSWLIGEKALLESGSRYLRTVDELVEMYPEFVRFCEEKAGVSGRDVIAIGLPFSAWLRDNEEGVFSGILRKGFSRLGYRDLFVFPQGLGGIKWFLSERSDISGNVLSVDIGFNTVIVVLYSIDEREVLFSETYYRKGVYDLVVSILLRAYL